MSRTDSPGPMTPVERRVTAALAAVFAMRMLGLFVVLPVMAVHAADLPGATPLLIGLAIGTYGLMQGILQIPFGVLSDRYGRKPLIVLGLLMFAAGGLLAAGSDSIWGVIVGRALQGCGAISGVVMALLADATRETHRARAMAAIGITIGLSFGLAMVLGPLVVAEAGLPGLFLFTSLMAVTSLLLVLGVVPTPSVPPPRTARRLWPRLVRVARHPGLFRLDLGVFLLHLVMVAVFVVIPPALVSIGGLPVASHWKVYLPVVLVSILTMAPILMRAERRGRVREAVLLGGTGIVLSLLMLAMADNLWLLVAGLLVYFVAFNLLEAAMPAMVSRVGPTWSRGAAMGVYSSSQFMGAFAGGVVGGGLASMFPPEGVLVSCALLFAAWVLFARTLRNARSARMAGPGAGVPQQGA